MFSSAALENQILAGVAGANLTLPDPVMESGFLKRSSSVVAMVMGGRQHSGTHEDSNKFVWNETSGLFTITELQKDDSAIYVIDSKKAPPSTSSYNVTVFDWAPLPAVEALTVSADRCLVRCSVDKPADLSWFRDDQTVNQSRGVISLQLSVQNVNSDSTYKCVASNPAEAKKTDADVPALCAEKTNWIIIVIVVLVLVLLGILLAAWLKKRESRTT